MRLSILALVLLAACGGSSSGLDTETTSAALITPTGGVYHYWSGHPDEAVFGVFCKGEVDLNRGRWFCGQGGYTQVGAASMYGTAVLTGGVLVLTPEPSFFVGDNSGAWKTSCSGQTTLADGRVVTLCAGGGTLLP